MIEAVVFFLFLICVTLVFIRTAIAVSRWKKHRFRFLSSWSLFCPSCIFLVRPAFDFLGWGDIVPEVQRAVVFLWALSVAFLVNSVLIRFFWDGLLSFHGERRVPKLITDVVGSGDLFCRRDVRIALRVWRADRPDFGHVRGRRCCHRFRSTIDHSRGFLRLFAQRDQGASHR